MRVFVGTRITWSVKAISIRLSPIRVELVGRNVMIRRSLRRVVRTFFEKDYILLGSGVAGAWIRCDQRDDDKRLAHTLEKEGSVQMAVCENTNQLLPAISRTNKYRWRSPSRRIRSRRVQVDFS
jgi:hypothetical protein